MSAIQTNPFAIVVLLGISGCAHSAAATGSDDSYRATFDVERGRLAATGASSYISLEPGTVHTYRGADSTLTIRVLDETRVIDGVTTRIIEEREESGGKLVEVSRNFFAIDPARGDVYYFGEEVDHYRNDAVTGHGGSWLAGIAGARFGLALPGKPFLGDRFQQEIAPGVAMDRVEIVGTNDRVETPAGVFEHCVHAKETTPLESDVGHKWYAPGVGLVRDDEVVLVSWTPAPR